MTQPLAMYSVTDMHAAGEPVRIITAGAPTLEGETLLAKRRNASSQHDAVRQHLMLEPRGHADMYGVWPTQPDHPDCALAVLFLHNGGYSTMCGHATIALGRWVIDQGIVPVTHPSTAFRLQCPCGPVDVSVAIDADGTPGAVSFTSVPAFAGPLDCALEVPNWGSIRIDIGYGGAFYAVLPAQRLGLSLASSPVTELINAGRAITQAGRAQLTLSHPDADDLAFLYGCIITDGNGPANAKLSRNLCIFGDGQVDRSATGSGITARLALAYAQGYAQPGQSYAFAGLSGVAFQGGVHEVKADGSVIVEVSGHGYYSGEARFWVEANDPLGAGFSMPHSLGD